MAADTAPILDNNSLMEVRPVTLDSGVPKSYGVPTPVKMVDLKSYFGSGGVPAAATTTTVGGVKQAAFQADFAGADITALKTELNAFKAKLIAAGIMAAS